MNTIYQYRRPNQKEWTDVTHEVWGALATSNSNHDLRYIDEEGVAHYPEAKPNLKEILPMQQTFFDRSMNVNYRMGLLHGVVIGIISTMIVIGSIMFFS